MLNWNLLYSQGRCKAIGVPWTNEEAEARSKLKIPAEYVRQGCLTLEDYEKSLNKTTKSIEKTNKIPLIHLKRNQLIVLCEKMEIAVGEEVTRPVLIEMLLDSGCKKSIPVEDIPEAQEEVKK